MHITLVVNQIHLFDQITIANLVLSMHEVHDNHIFTEMMLTVLLVMLAITPWFFRKLDMNTKDDVEVRIYAMTKISPMKVS